MNQSSVLRADAIEPQPFATISVVDEDLYLLIPSEAAEDPTLIRIFIRDAGEIADIGFLTLSYGHYCRIEHAAMLQARLGKSVVWRTTPPEVPVAVFLPAICVDCFDHAASAAGGDMVGRYLHQVLLERMLPSDDIFCGTGKNDSIFVSRSFYDFLSASFSRIAIRFDPVKAV